MAVAASRPLLRPCCYRGRIFVLRSILVVAVMLAASPASADVTGRYTGPGGGIVTVEVDEDGSVRFQPEGADNYQLFRGGEGYVVELYDGGPVVMRWADLTAHYNAELAEVVGGDVAATEAEAPAETMLVPAGSTTVEGREGKSYVPRDAIPASAPAIVISSDPALRPLGQAWQAVIARMPTFGMMLTGNPDAVTRELSALFGTGAPLQLAEIRLIGASQDDVPAERFALPAEPLNREQLAEFLRARPDAN